MKRSTTALFVLLILGSLTLGLAAMLLQAGHDATPYGTRDSQGHPLGFNDPITSELCWIMVSHVTLGSFIEGLGWYGVLYLLMHLVGLALVLRDRFGIRTAYLWSQLLLFPTVWLILLMIGWECVAVLSGSIQGPVFVLDGETFQDGPPFWWMAQPSWLVVSMLIASNGTWGPQAQTVSAGPGSPPVNNPTPSRPSDRLRVFASLR
jgi:hypothetical protein